MISTPGECAPVLVHFHIFKNAGTSVDAALARYFGDAWCPFEGRHAHDIQTGEQLAGFLKDRPDVRAVSSHLARPPLPYANVFPIVFLRHPLLRAKSVYEFTKKDDSQPFRNGALGTFSDYLKWVVRGEDGSVVVRNYQVIHLSRASFCAEGILRAAANADNLLEAVRLVSSWPAIGIVERYADSIRLFEQKYKEYFPGLSLGVMHENRSGSPNTIQSIVGEVGAKLVEEFYSVNRLDFALYRFVCALFRELVGRMNVDN